MNTEKIKKLEDLYKETQNLYEEISEACEKTWKDYLELVEQRKQVAELADRIIEDIYNEENK